MGLRWLDPPIPNASTRLATHEQLVSIRYLRAALGDPMRRMPRTFDDADQLLARLTARLHGRLLDRRHD